MARSEWIGRKLSNRYVIEELLGQGGMSSVFKATDPNLRRVVAIKMIHPHLSTDPDFLKRFEEEASGVAQLRHQRIIQVYDFNEDDGVYYMVLEFVPGENLQDLLKRLNEEGRKLPVARAIEYIADICDAVDYAHRRGMIHRDIKPANIMLNLQDEAILMDFGIAKMVSSQRHTATGAVVGSAKYMSPERIKGERPDSRTDIYSLGVTLFEMVSGRPPFQADSAMTLMMMHVNDPVPDPRKLNPEVPDDLVAVINKALAKSPNDRYQTAAEMASALRKILTRLSSDVPAAVPPAEATMIEDMPKMTASPEATFLEAPAKVPSAPGTVVETGYVPKETSAEGKPSAEASTESPPSPATRVSIGRTSAGSAERVVEGPPPPRVPQSQPKKAGLSMPVIAGIGLLLACLIFGGIFIVNRLLSGGAAPPTEQPVLLMAQETETPAPTATAEMTATSEATAAPSPTPTITTTPTATVPPGIPFVRINSITIDDQQRYVVEYETFEFTEILPGVHIHFYFDTVPPENAGSPGTGPWFLYGGPRPFTGYSVAERPAAATQMCALVANNNHSVQPDSGNCVDLP